MGTPNKIINTIEGQSVYHSRSVVVMVAPIFKVGGKKYVPLGLRSQGLSESGKFGLPCGYLDWDEAGWEAAIRESQEEIGLDLSQYLKEAQPWHVHSSPTEDVKQNVTLRYRCLVIVKELPSLILSKEVKAVKWVEIEQAIMMPLAFNHSEILAQVKKYFCI